MSSEGRTASSVPLGVGIVPLGTQQFYNVGLQFSHEGLGTPIDTVVVGSSAELADLENTKPVSDKKADIERRRQELEKKYEATKQKHLKELEEAGVDLGKWGIAFNDIIHNIEEENNSNNYSKEWETLAREQYEEWWALNREKQEIESDANKLSFSDYNFSGKESILDKLKKAISKVYQSNRQALDEGFSEWYTVEREVASVGGNQYSAHGMGKTSIASAFTDLINLFEKGINPFRGQGALDVATLAGGVSDGTTAGVDKTPIAIVIDPLADDGGLATSGTISVLCLVSGIAGVKKEFLSFTDANEAKVIAAIEANMGGVLVVDSQDPIA